MCTSNNVRTLHECQSDEANGMMYNASMLLITGSLGTGKSWLIKIITELAELIDLYLPVRTAFMGIAAIKIDGCTMNSFLDVPLEMNEGKWTYKSQCKFCQMVPL